METHGRIHNIFSCYKLLCVALLFLSSRRMWESLTSVLCIRDPETILIL